MSKPGWQQLAEGTVVPSGSALDFHTGDWRSERPIFHEKNCIQCLICWMVCPDSAVKLEAGKVVGFDYDYCKGCGICNNECPTRPDKRAITMEREEK